MHWKLIRRKAHFFPFAVVFSLGLPFGTRRDIFRRGASAKRAAERSEGAPPQGAAQIRSKASKRQPQHMHNVPLELRSPHGGTGGGHSSAHCLKVGCFLVCGCCLLVLLHLCGVWATSFLAGHCTAKKREGRAPEKSRQKNACIF